MRSIAVALALVLGCGSGAPSAQPGSAVGARPAIVDPLGFCARDRLAIVRRQGCFPEDQSLKMAIDDLDRRVDAAPADPEKRRALGAQCAIDLHSIMRAEQPKDCPLDMTDPERAELAAFLAAWFGERMPVPTTGDVAADAALAALAKQRDAACACKAMACLRPIMAALGDPPSDPPAAAKAGARMVDEVARCKQQLLLP